MSKYTPKFYGVIEHGQFKAESEDDVIAHTSKLPDGTEVEMTIKKRSKHRTQGAVGESTNQNGYLWGVLIKGIADEMGEFDHDAVYGWVQIAIGNFRVMRDGTKIPAGTSDMEAGEFQEWCKKIQVWAATPGNVCEKGLYLPDPNEADYNV